jgi:hypothetical protein
MPPRRERCSESIIQDEAQIRMAPRRAPGIDKNLDLINPLITLALEWLLAV